MSGIARVNQDSAGGIIQGQINSTVIVNGTPASVIGDAVAGHGIPPHSSPTMSEGSATVFVNGIPVCREGDKATCGHPATGSSNVFAG